MRQFDRWTVLAALAVVFMATAAQGQSPFPTSPPPGVQSAFPQQVPAQPLSASPYTAQPAAAAIEPESAYISQLLFQIPYKWDSGSTATNASAVKLFLSQDRGATWSEIVSDAKPEVQFFQYHAPSDGEYLFAIQTIDAQGRAWPAGPPQGELLVKVDTQNPTITALKAQLTSAGTVAAVWQASDANLDTARATIEYRTPSDSCWQSVPGGSLQVPAAGYAQGQANWQVPPGTEVVWVRLGVRDLAGNVREAGAEARVNATPGAQLASSSYRLPPVSPPTANSAGATAIAANTPSANSPFGTSPTTTAASPSPSVGWSGFGDTHGSASSATAATTPPPAIQHWPSDGQSPVPLGSPRTAEVRRLAPPPASVAMSSTDSTTQGDFGWKAGTQAEGSATPFRLPQSTPNYPQMRTASARPFQGAAAPRELDGNIQAPALHRLPSLADTNTQQPAAGVTGSANHSSQSEVQHLNSLDFEIGYDVDTAGTYGVTRVELWGTPDGGHSWRRLSVDTDNRSPILATVPAPGDYGLKIVVETAGGIDPVRPRPGDRPEIFVRVDTTPPVAKLTGIRQGSGAEANQLKIDWQSPASLPADEKATLQYSSTPTGPWVDAASNLPHSGHYALRLSRHLPTTFYVRLEVRDAAGNVASDQTQVPVTITLPSPSGRLGSVRALQ